MKLKELRWKKTIMALAAVVFTASDLSLFWHFDARRYGETWNSINSILPRWFPLPLQEIAFATGLGVLLGKDNWESLKLILLGLVVAIIVASITLLCLFLSTDIPILK
ncbi:MAG: hypothetical protein P4N59_25630 [Negativicutes bacterium]|nr:hypothetical protein [Negativicutes bacterium]